MQDDVDILEILTSLSEESISSSQREVPRSSSLIAPAEALSITIKIERDLAVMLVGSDAGRCDRIRPHSAMTFGSSPSETLNVQTLLEPFLRDEIHRVKVDKTHRPKATTVQASTEQALALKAFCLRYAAFIRDHLDGHPQDDRAHRSRQRLEQAYRVIDQVNTALGKTFDDGRTLAQCEREVFEQVFGLGNAIEDLKARALVTAAESSIAPLLELHEAVIRCLRRYSRA